MIDPSVMEQATLGSKPLVSVITPFYNTAPYLAQCIESVLAQSYTKFEYILLDNCSTDGSSEIAERYSGRDSRIRFIRCSQFVSQLENYNRALTEISEASQYCKVVSADDYIFPEYLRLMVQAFERSESIGLVSSYGLWGNVIRGAPATLRPLPSDYPYPTPILSGREVARWYLRTGIHIFGSPTTVMYRSSLVRNQRAFYDESALHADTEKCMEILAHCDFGFVHQVLSFVRRDNDSTSSAFREFEPYILDRYIIVRRYSLVFLEASEAAARRKDIKRLYYRTLAAAAIRFRERAFWQYHNKGLKSLGEALDWPYLALHIGLEIGREFLRTASNPRSTMKRALRLWKSRTGLPAPDPGAGRRGSLERCDGGSEKGDACCAASLGNYRPAPESNLGSALRETENVGNVGQFGKPQ
jgi:glycosyltransferase involved in cell wall biosynthesis